MSKLPKSIITGRVGEQYSRVVQLDVSEEMEQFPGTGPVLLYRRPGEDTLYPGTITFNSDTNIIEWVIDGAVTAVAGADGAVQIMFSRNDNSMTVIGRSFIIRLSVLESLTNPDSEPPDSYETWLENLTTLAAQTQGNAASAQQSASSASASATAAGGYAASAQQAVADAQSVVQDISVDYEALDQAVSSAASSADLASGSADAASASAGSAASAATSAMNGATQASLSASAARLAANEAAGTITEIRQKAEAAAASASDADSSAEAALKARDQLFNSTARCTVNDRGYVAVDLIEEDDHKVFLFELSRGPEGKKGDKGDRGSGLYITGTVASVSDLPATAPQSTMYAVGAQTPYSIYVYDNGTWLDLGILQGPDGAPGKKGDTGEKGDAAGFATPTASVDANVGTPSVTVTATGPDTAKQFDFQFHNLKGEAGADGKDGADGATGPQGNPGPGVPRGGTTNQVLRKVDGTDYNTEWHSLDDADIPSSAVSGQTTVEGALSSLFQQISNVSIAAEPPTNARPTDIDGVKTYLSGIAATMRANEMRPVTFTTTFSDDVFTYGIRVCGIIQSRLVNAFTFSGVDLNGNTITISLNNDVWNIYKVARYNPYLPIAYKTAGNVETNEIGIADVVVPAGFFHNRRVVAISNITNNLLTQYSVSVSEYTGIVVKLRFRNLSDGAPVANATISTDSILLIGY